MKRIMIYMAVLLMGISMSNGEVAAQESDEARIYTIVVDRFLNADSGNDNNVTMMRMHRCLLGATLKASRTTWTTYRAWASIR